MIGMVVNSDKAYKIDQVDKMEQDNAIDTMRQIGQTGKIG